MNNPQIKSARGECFLCTFTRDGVVIERGHMLFADAQAVAYYAQVMGFAVEFEACSSDLCCIAEMLRETAGVR